MKNTLNIFKLYETLQNPYIVEDILYSPTLHPSSFSKPIPIQRSVTLDLNHIFQINPASDVMNKYSRITASVYINFDDSWRIFHVIQNNESIESFNFDMVAYCYTDRRRGYSMITVTTPLSTSGLLQTEMIPPWLEKRQSLEATADCLSFDWQYK